MTQTRNWKYQLIASCEAGSRDGRGPSGFPLSREVAFWTAVVSVATASGGLILGVGPFGDAMTREGLATVKIEVNPSTSSRLLSRLSSSSASVERSLAADGEAPQLCGDVAGGQLQGGGVLRPDARNSTID